MVTGLPSKPARRSSRTPRYASGPVPGLADSQGRGTASCETPVGCLDTDDGGRFHCPDGGDFGVDGRLVLRVKMPSGEPYPGDLLDDILEYRRLRAIHLSRTTSNVGRLEKLETLLRAVPREDGGRNVRAYHRFDIEIDAKLRFIDDGEVTLVDVQTVNLSAGGVKLHTEHQRPAGEQVWLLLPRGSSIVVLPSRVAWSRGPSAGLMFAGAPTTARGARWT